MFSQTVWDGPLVTFTKHDDADPSLESSQDRITDLVWLTGKKMEDNFIMLKLNQIRQKILVQMIPDGPLELHHTYWVFNLFYI